MSNVEDTTVEEAAEMMQMMAHAIEAMLNPDGRLNGFVLIAFPLHTDGIVNYVANIDNDAVDEALKSAAFAVEASRAEQLGRVN